MSNNFIAAEEFLKQSDKMQKELISYFTERSKENNLTIFYLGTKMALANRYEWSRPIFKYQFQCSNIVYDRIIPALSMSDLFEFIESKANGIVKVIQWHLEDNDVSKRGYSIYLLSKDKYHVLYHYKDLGEDLLLALWQVAIKVCEEKSNNEDI